MVRYAIKLDIVRGSVSVRVNDLCVIRRAGPGTSEIQVVNDVIHAGTNEAHLVWEDDIGSLTKVGGPQAEISWFGRLQIGQISSDGVWRGLDTSVTGDGPSIWRIDSGRAILTLSFEVPKVFQLRTPFESGDLILGLPLETRSSVWNFVSGLHKLLVGRDVGGLVEASKTRTLYQADVLGIPFQEASTRANAWWEMFCSMPEVTDLPGPGELYLDVGSAGRSIEILVGSSRLPVLSAADPVLGMRVSMPITLVRRGGNWIWLR